MPTWIAFQRAVNVGGRKYPMADLRELLTQAGYDGVETHIQSGNIKLVSSTRSATRLEMDLEKLFRLDRGFEVPTVVVTQKELADVVVDADAVEAEFGVPQFGHYIEVMRGAPDADAAALIEGHEGPGQKVVLRGRIAHLLVDIPFHEVKPPPAATKRAYGVSTNRNLTVIRTLADKWC